MYSFGYKVRRALGRFAVTCSYGKEDPIDF